MSNEVEPERVRRLDDREPMDGTFVLYWMQQSGRADFNPALEFAVAEANARDLPLLVVFGLMRGYPEANLRSYRFLLEGLQDSQKALEKRGIKMVVRLGDPDEVALKAAKGAALVVCDRGYLRHQKAWREVVAHDAHCPVVEVEGDVVVPVDLASDKAETAARTLRPKLRKLIDRFLVKPTVHKIQHTSLRLKETGEDLSDLDRLEKKLELDRSVGPVPDFKGGGAEARRLLREFLRGPLEGYEDHRGKPGTDHVSHMSKYLHFGNISPVEIAIGAREAGAPASDLATFLEELIVRRELAQNLANFDPDYDRYEGLPDWAKQTLRDHRRDPRPHVYDREQLESGATHDRYWNAAMAEMRGLGYMHNHMRMYWGKKILEWSESPEEAFDNALRINNKYFLDGRDANSFANVAWVFGRHDRPWPDRPIFGKVRSMTAGGLERKNDPEAYVAKVEDRVGPIEGGATED